MEKTKKREFLKIEKIKGPGEYRFATDGNWDGGFLYGDYPSNTIMGEHPLFKYDEIPNFLREKFPQTFLQHFIPAILDDFSGKYEPAHFDFEHKWNSVYSEGNFIGCDGEMYFISSGGTFSNGSGSWDFAIKDVGNLSILENKLVIAKPEGRNASLELSISGSAPHHTTTGDYWRAWINYKRTKPGKLVKAVTEYILSEKERLKAPLWKKSA